MNAESLLTLSDVTVTYPAPSPHLFGRKTTKTVVDKASFSIGTGETFGLIGESGSGKSTIGRAILRLVPIRSGEITFNGERIDQYGSRTPLDYRRRVQCVYQDPLNSLNPRQSIEEAVDEAVKRHSTLSSRDRTARVKELFNDVGIAWHHSRKRPHQLSGGQQQRVAIARALAPEPELIVCDEAVSALDVSTQSQVINLFEDIQAARGISYLFITHDMSVVRHISSRIAIIQNGVILETGETEDVFTAPKTDYTQSLLDAVPRLA